MKKKARISLYPYGLWIFMIFIGAFYSCKKEGPNLDQYKETNHWIAEQMRIYYYWAAGLPVDQRLNFNQPPDVFFEDLRNPADRFSWIDLIENLKDDLQGIVESTGLEFSLYGYSENRVFGAVLFVVPGSPAEQAGLKRGDIFTRVNGTQMTTSNYNALLDPYYKGTGFEITLGSLSANVITEGDTKVSLTVARLDEPSVYHKQVLQTGSGRNVGYVFYNRFLNGKSAELFDAFNSFKNRGVQDVILDLRYNLGGGIGAAATLSALVAPGYSFEDIFVKYQYNAMLNQYFDTQDPDERSKSFRDVIRALSAFPTSNTVDSIQGLIQNARLELPRVFVLATGSSASASELIINNLSPFMEVVHIGDTTMGKNEGSITIDPMDKDFNPKGLDIDWGIQPIIMKLANNKDFGDYHEGLVPDFLIEERPPFAPLGSANDPLVARALAIIDPGMETAMRNVAIKQGVFNKLFTSKRLHMRVRSVNLDGTISLPSPFSPR